MGLAISTTAGIVSAAAREDYKLAAFLGWLASGVTAFFSPLLGLATAFGPSVVTAWRTRHAIKQLQAASRDPDLVRQFFDAHPGLYRNFLNGPFTQAFTAEKQRAQAQVQALRTKIATFNASKTNPALQLVADNVRATIVWHLDKKIAEYSKVIALLQTQIIAPMDKILRRIPGFAEVVSAQIRHRDDWATVEQIAAEAELDNDIVAAVGANIAEAHARLARAIQEATDTLTDVRLRLSADAEVAALTMPGADALAAQIDALDTEEVEITPARAAAVVEVAEVAAAR